MMAKEARCVNIGSEGVSKDETGLDERGNSKDPYSSID